MGDAAAVEQDAAVQLVDDALTLARRGDRADLVERLAIARARLVRPGTVVVVVGEFKQGKSSLVNAVLGQDVCPVDDDLATSVVTVVHHAPTPGAIERRRTDDGVVTEQVPLGEVREHVTEAGNPGNQRAVERLDLGVPVDLLADGLMIVDTPGMGGLGAGHSASTLGFLPYADALLFVTDASQELTRTEVDLLQRAVEVCPLVVTCLTKVDLHPEWRRIRDLDRGHMERAGIDCDIVPVSATVRSLAIDRDDPQLDAESGIPVLVDRLRADVVERARGEAARRAGQQVVAVVDQLEAAAASELEALRDPDRARTLASEVEHAQQRLEHLRGPAARWRTVLGDRVTDLGQQTSHDLRREVRELSRGLDDEVAELASDEDWQQLARTMQQRTAEVVAALFATVEGAGEDLRDELLELLGAEEVALPGVDVAVDFDVTTVWHADAEDTGESVAQRLGASLGALRRAQTGVIMFGMMGRMLPAAATSLLASNPILLGAGVLLGGKALVDQRRRQVEERRHHARLAVRRFLDDLQFELTPVLADAVRDLQRTLRDGVAAAVDELQRTWSETGRRARQALEATTEARQTRVPELESFLTELARVRAGAAEVVAAGDAGGDAGRGGAP